MQDINKDEQLVSLIREIENNLGLLSFALIKSYFCKARARKSRVLSLKLEKLFKKFRKRSLQLGLK